MTSADLRAFLAETTLTPDEWALLLGVDQSCVRRWLAGTRSIPPWLPLIIRMWRMLPISKKARLLR